MYLKDTISGLKIIAIKSVEKILNDTQRPSEQVTKSQAYKLYGRSIIDRWVKEGIIQTNGKYFERAKLEAIAFSSNRRSYLCVADR